MIDLASIRGRHSGKRAIVLGGGPSLVSDLRLVRPRVEHLGVWLGVNQHSLLLPLDYIVFQDKELHPILTGHDVPLVTHHKDIADIWSGIVPDFGFSGGTAVWIADYLGCSEIYVCGCDNYTSNRRYWHSKLGDYRFDEGISNIAAWTKVRDYMANPDRVRVISGPLTKVFSPYEG